MGICHSENKKALSNPANKTNSRGNHNGNGIVTPNENFKKSLNPNSEITNKSSSTIVKTIGQIKGDALRLQRNTDCVIMIMDHSSSVSIQECTNCSIFIAPCASSIIIRNCANINVISASSQLRITNVSNSNFYAFSSTSPAIEASQNISWGMLFVQYTELPEMFKKSKLNVWENSWSQFEKFGNDVDVKYANNDIKQSVLQKFSSGFNESYVNVDQFQFFPFQYGNSLKLNNMFHILLVVKEANCVDSEILAFLSPDELQTRSLKTVKTKIIKTNGSEYKEWKAKADRSKNPWISDYFSSDRINRQNTKNSNKNNITGTNVNKWNPLDMTGNDHALGNTKTWQKEEVLVVWLVSGIDSYEDCNDYVEETWDINNLALIKKNDFEMNDSNFEIFIRKIVNMNSKS